MHNEGIMVPTSHGVFYPVDEFDIFTGQRVASLVDRVFQLTFAALCDELIQQVKIGCCDGCAINHLSQTAHSCLMINQEDAWFRYFDQAVEKVDLVHVMKLAQNVCSTLGIYVSDNWQSSLAELPKLPRTALYLSSLELKNSGNVVQVEEIVDRVIYAIYNGLNGQKREAFSNMQSVSYCNQELRSTELTNDYEVYERKEGSDKELSKDIDLVISEIQNNLRF